MQTQPILRHYEEPVYAASFPFSVHDTAPSSFVRGRFHHTGVVNILGDNVDAFCQTVTVPALQPIATQVRKLLVDFQDVRPTRASLELLSRALALLANCTDLTLLGLPSPEHDGWVLRDAACPLERFITNLSLTAKDVADFLRRQPALRELGTTSPPSHLVQPRSTYQHDPFPCELAPALRTLDCPAPFLMSLQATTPPTRPLTNIRLDLNRLNSQVEIEALTALSMFSPTVERLSVRRSVLRTSPAVDSIVAMNMASVIARVCAKKQWAKLKFLEMRDGMYDSMTIPTLAQAVATCCPNIETLVWAPAAHPSGSTHSVPFIASIFFTFNKSLHKFIFLDDSSNLQQKKFVMIAKTAGGLSELLVKPEDVENMWKIAS